MRVAEFEWFFGKESGVNTPVDHSRTAFMCNATHFVAAQGIAGVDTDANDVTWLDCSGV
jgi:hypothetical protein